MVLYVNSCVRKNSRTDLLSKVLLKKLGGNYEEIKLEHAGLKPIDETFINRRIGFASKGDFSDQMFDNAKKFKEADTIVISAPFWDMSFPSALKVFIENIYAIGLVTTYDEKGLPKGLCRAKKLYYVSTAGGKFFPEFGYDYIKSLCNICFGISDTELIFAEMLDVVGNDPGKIIEEKIKEIEEKSFL